MTRLVEKTFRIMSVVSGKKHLISSYNQNSPLLFFLKQNFLEGSFPRGAQADLDLSI